MTEYSSGRNKSCWNIESAIRSLMITPSARAPGPPLAKSLSATTYLYFDGNHFGRKGHAIIAKEVVPKLQ